MEQGVLEDFLPPENFAPALIGPSSWPFQVTRFFSSPNFCRSSLKGQAYRHNQIDILATKSFMCIHNHQAVQIWIKLIKKILYILRSQSLRLRNYCFHYVFLKLVIWKWEVHCIFLKSERKRYFSWKKR